MVTIIVNCTNCGRMLNNGVWDFPDREDYLEITAEDVVYHSYKQCPECLHEVHNTTLCGNPAVPHKNKGKGRLRSVVLAAMLATPLATPILQIPEIPEGKAFGESRVLTRFSCVRNQEEMDCVVSIGKDGTKYITSRIGEKIYEIYKEIDGEMFLIYKNKFFKDTEI